MTASDPADPGPAPGFRRRSPEPLLGRVTSAFWTLQYSAAPVGAAVLTWAAEREGTAPVAACSADSRISSSLRLSSLTVLVAGVAISGSGSSVVSG